MGAYLPPARRDNPQDDFLQYFLMGRQMMMQNKQFQDRSEERKLLMEQHKQAAAHQKLQDKLDARDHALKMRDVLESIPGMQRQKEIPMGEGGGSFDIQGMPEAQIPSLNIPGVEELGLPGTDIPIRSMEEKLAQVILAKKQEAQGAAEGKAAGEMVDLPPELAARFPGMGAGGRVDPDVLKAAEPFGKTQVPGGIYSRDTPVGKAGVAGSMVEKGALPLVQSAYGEQEGTRRAGIQAGSALAVAKERGRQATSKFKPATDEMGNFTGTLFNESTGETREAPGLRGLRGKPLTGMIASRVNQATNVINAGEMLISTIPSIADKIGPIMGRGFNLWKMYGDPDPDVNRFASELASFAALQPALHGFRGQQALREFERIIGGPPTSPEALQASIEGIMRTAGIVEGGARPGASDRAEGSAHTNQAAPAGGLPVGTWIKGKAGDMHVWTGTEWCPPLTEQ